MKLRNKLVAVMAASTVVTSLPVVTMADSSNTINVYNYNIKDKNGNLLQYSCLGNPMDRGA